MLMKVKKNFGKSLTLFLLALSLWGCGAKGEPVAAAQSTEEPTVQAEIPSSAQRESGMNQSVKSIESEGFEKPEEALAAYLMGIKEMDYTKMLGSFAVESYVKNFDFQKNLDRNRGYTPSQVIKYPSSNPLLESINVESRRNMIAQDITNQYLVFGYTDFENEPDFRPDVPRVIDEGHTSEAFLNNMNGFLGGIQPESLNILGSVPPSQLSDVYSQEWNLNVMKSKEEVYGADKIEGCAVVFEIHGDRWILCADTVNYGGKWYIMDLKGGIGGLLGFDPSFGGVMPILDWDSQWEGKLVPLGQ